MTLKHTVLLVTLAISCYNIGVIWLMQILIYPQFTDVGPGDFPAYHLAHWHRIRYVVFVPAVLALLGAVLLLWLAPPGIPAWARWCGVLVQVVTYLTTWLWWAPLQVRLAREGNVPGLVHRLIRTHWLRVTLITFYGLLALWMVTQSFGPTG